MRGHHKSSDHYLVVMSDDENDDDVNDNGIHTQYVYVNALQAACKSACLQTTGCTVFKYCDSTDACKNYWSRGGAQGFEPRPPNPPTHH